MMNPSKNIRDNLGALGLFVLFALFSSLIFGFTHEPTWQDASQYSAYASNLISGNGYSLDGLMFSNFREPGYPFFLALIYFFFGDENITAVTIAQAILLSLIAFMFYLMLSKLDHSRGGLFLGALITLFPSYGYYTHEVGSEMLFAFFVSLSAFVLFFIIRKGQEGSAHLAWYLLLGVVIGYGALVRIQFLFFLPIFFFVAIIFFQKVISWKGLLFSLMIYSSLIGGWSLYSYSHTGDFSLSNGRPEVILYARAIRSELSYKELGQYYVAWVHKRVSADYTDPMLKRADLVGLTSQYVSLATTSEVILQQKARDIHTLLTHPLHYLAGNFVEVAKLYYIEYLYTPHLSREVRAGIYASLYSWVIFGAWSLFRHRKLVRRGIWELSAIMASFVFYNAFILSFFDTIPRYNTPFLVFFLAFGFLGLLQYREKRLLLRE